MNRGTKETRAGYANANSATVPLTRFLRGAALIQRECQQVAVGRLAPCLTCKPVKKRGFSHFGIEPPLAPIVTHVGTKLRQHIFLKGLTGQFPFRLTLFLV